MFAVFTADEPAGLDAERCMHLKSSISVFVVVAII